MPRRMIRIAAAALSLSLAACSGADLARTCEDIEPWRPLIRGAVTAVEPVAAIPFVFTRQVSCADAEAVAERLRDQR
jgi:hypothetical protein